MADVVVKPVISKRDRRAFLELPWSLYQSDPNWIPPLLQNQKELLGFWDLLSPRRHPFHDHAELATFVAWRDGYPRGRIAVTVNHEHNRVHRDWRGFFGFFDSVDDQDVAAALFDRARAWLAERGIHRLRGPANPSMNYECGLLVEGFDSPPTFMMTYNPPYYERLFADYGFEKAHDLLAFEGQRAQLPDVESQLGNLAEQAQARCHAIIRPLNTARFRDDVELFVDLYNRSCVSMWGFVPLPPDEIRKLAGSLRHLLVPELAMFAEVDGQGVGAVIGLPDYNPRIRDINGKLYPLGFLKLLRNPRGIRRIRVLSIAVVPEYQRWGLGLVLMRSLVPKAMELGVEEAEFSWVSEANTLARMGLEKAGARLKKTYRMYDYGPAEVEQDGRSQAPRAVGAASVPSA